MQSGIKAADAGIVHESTVPKPEKLESQSQLFFSSFQLHVVDNLIPTLISWVAAGQCLAQLEHDKQFERYTLNDDMVDGKFGHRLLNSTE